MTSPRASAAWILALAGILPAVLSAQEPADPARFEETIAAWEAEDRLNPPPPNAILITGSSSITRWNHEMEADLAPLTVIPRGFGGSRMADVLHYVDRVIIAYEPRAVVIYEGDNDTWAGFSAETIVGQFEEIAARIHDALPETRIHIMSVKPSVARRTVWPEAQRTNRMLQAIAAGNDLIHYLDAASHMLRPNGEVMTDIFVEDNLHLNEKGTDIWAAAIREGLLPVELRYESTEGG